MTDAADFRNVRLTHSLDHLMEMLRGRRTAVKSERGLDLDYETAWEPDALCHEAADEIEAMRELLRLVRSERDELAAKHYAAVAAERERCARIVEDMVCIVDGADAVRAILGGNEKETA